MSLAALLNDNKMLGSVAFATFNLIFLVRLRTLSSLSISGASSNFVSKQSALVPIKAKKVPSKITFGVNGDEYRGENPMDPPRVRIDYYNWLRDETRKDEEVLAHLLGENEYCAQATKHFSGLQESLYSEILSHLKETDEDVPYQHGQFEYYTRTVQGLSYKIHCRKPVTGGPEEIILDENEVAKGHEYCDVSELVPSPDHSLLAYTVDHSGYETYTIYVKNLSTGEILSDTIEGSDGNVVWDHDCSRIYYMTMDDEHRPDQLHVHVFGTAQSDDVCLYTEDDSRFWMGITKTASDRFFILSVDSKETSENFILDLSIPISDRKLVSVSPRVFGIRYEVEHLVTGTDMDKLLIVTNKDVAKNNKLMSVDVNKSGDSSLWTDVKAYDNNIQIDDVLPFASYTAIVGRADGLEKVWIAKNSDLSTWNVVSTEESVYSLWCGDNYIFDAKKIRLVYSSLITPKTWFDYDLDSKTKTILKIQDVPSYDKSQYVTKRLYACAKDGRQIPLSIVHHKKVELPTSTVLRTTATTSITITSKSTSAPIPTILYGYGSYGHSIDPVFDYKRIPLLDRGCVYVIAHIRGGGEMGRSWYEDEGKYLSKMNTFTDFGACAKMLIDTGITSNQNLCIVGRSAGGLLVGATVNLFPSLFKAAVADVPFVDALNTMSDPNIPLTVTEWEEWGNPNEEKYYDYMETYSPYDNVKAQNYPAILVNAGLNDPRVAYWEPAKWVAKLREYKTDSNPLLLKTDMGSGHFSASDRYKYIRETAFEYAFILDQIVNKD